METSINIPEEALKYFSLEELVKEAEEAVKTRLEQRKQMWQGFDKLEELRKKR